MNISMMWMGVKSKAAKAKGEKELVLGSHSQKAGEPESTSGDKTLDQVMKDLSTSLCIRVRP